MSTGWQKRRDDARLNTALRDSLVHTPVTERTKDILLAKMKEKYPPVDPDEGVPADSAFKAKIRKFLRGEWAEATVDMYDEIDFDRNESAVMALEENAKMMKSEMSTRTGVWCLIADSVFTCAQLVGTQAQIDGAKLVFAEVMSAGINSLRVAQPTAVLNTGSGSKILKK